MTVMLGAHFCHFVLCMHNDMVLCTESLSHKYIEDQYARSPLELGIHWLISCLHAVGVQNNMMGLSNPPMQPGMIPIGNQMHMAPHMGMPRNMHQMNMSGIL